MGRLLSGISRTIAVWRDASISNRGKPKIHRRRAETEFLPALLEVTESPPSPIGRFLLWSIILFVAIAVAWAWIGKIDINASALSRIIPSGRVKTIQPLELGVIKSIRVREGQAVRAGEILVELDPTDSAADYDRFERELVQQQITIARLSAFLKKPTDPISVFSPPKGATPELIDLHTRLLKSTTTERVARLTNLRSQKSQRLSERDAVTTTIERLKKTIPLMTQRVEAIKTLTEQGHFPKLRYLELQQQQIEQLGELEAQTHRLAETKSAISAVEEQINQVEAEYRRSALDEMSEAERTAAGVRQEQIKASKRNKLSTLTSPIDGVVQQLSIFTVGGIVQPAEPLMVIVPDGNIEVEAKVLNKDIGFVHEGQTAEIKLEAFPFTRYGSIPGKIVDLSNDAVQDENLGPVYTARVSMDRNFMNVDGKQVTLTPGMTATVDIRTGQRRIIEFILSPLLRYQQESLKER